MYTYIYIYEGHSKSSETNSKKYFIYEIYKIILWQNEQNEINLKYLLQ